MQRVKGWLVDNHKLVQAFVLGVLSALFAFGLVSMFTAAPQPAIEPRVGGALEGTLSASQISPMALHDYVNKERIKQNRQPLGYDERLAKSAADKCNDIVSKNYWSHDTPGGEKPWKFILPYIDNYDTLGENLATGQHTASEVVKDWTISPAHYANLLRAEFQFEGFAVCKSESFVGQGGYPALITVQHFVGY